MANVAPLSGQDYEGPLMGAELRRPRVCSKVCAALIAILAFAMLIHLSLLAAMKPDVVVVFFRALALSTLLSLLPLALLWLLERRERRTPWLFAAAFLWGGCIATALALPLNTAFFGLVDQWLSQNPDIIWLLGPDAPTLLAAPISAPIAEELVKALGVVVIFWILRAEHNGLRDGLVYGALVGAGFNWFEAALYVAQGYAEYGVASYGLQLGGRYALLGLGGHAMLTGMFGAFYGLALQTRRKWVRVLAPIFGLVLAIAAHMVNNALPLIGVLAGVAAGEPPLQGEPPPDMGFLEAFSSHSLIELIQFLPFLLISVLALWRSSVRERRVIDEELAGEATDIVSPQEYQDVLEDHMLQTRRIDPMRHRASAALVNAQHELGFRKRRVREEGNDPRGDHLAAGWREDIRRVRRFIPA
jgi:RsiW-degrading membrane proteinase PrsW (M82 family)